MTWYRLKFRSRIKTLLLLVFITAIPIIHIIVCDKNSCKANSNMQLHTKAIAFKKDFKHHKLSNASPPIRKNFTKTHHPPKAIMVGFPKCGTASIEQFLTINPAIVKVKKENLEVHYFNTKLYNRGIDWYKKILPKHYHDQIGIERTATYAFYDTAPERIKQLNSSMRIIMSICDPVRRLKSKYTQMQSWRRKTRADKLPFEDMFVDRKTSRVRNKMDVNRGIYYTWIKKWMEYFPANQIHVVDGGNFKKDPVFELQKIEKFLGAPSVIQPNNVYLDDKSGFHCMRVNGENICMNKLKGRKSPDVDPEIVQILQDFYKPHNEALNKLMNRTFSFSV